MNLIYVANGDVSVYESQVLELLKYMCNNGIHVTLLQGYKDEEEKQKLEYKLKKYCFINVVWVKSYSVYSFFTKWMISNFYSALISVKNWETSVIHVRNEYMGFIFKEIAKRYKIKNKILIDIRAVVLEELRFKYANSSKVNKLKILLQICFFKSFYSRLFYKDDLNIHITSVSKEINNYIIKNYEDCNYPFYVNYNICGEQFKFSLELRKKIRNDLGLRDNDLLVICSTGGGAIWQKDYVVVEHLISMGFKVLFLSRENPGISGCIHRHVLFSDMPAYLSAADISILWRDNIFMNKSASPSKFSEFATMGLFCIHNKSVQVAIDYLEKTKSGKLVDSLEDVSIEVINNVDFGKRKEWIDCAEMFFSVRAIGNSYIDIYKKR